MSGAEPVVSGMRVSSSSSGIGGDLMDSVYPLKGVSRRQSRSASAQSQLEESSDPFDLGDVSNDETPADIQF